MSSTCSFAGVGRGASVYPSPLKFRFSRLLRRPLRIVGGGFLLRVVERNEGLEMDEDEDG